MRSLFVVGAFVTWAQTAWADQTLSLRTQMSVHGDFILIGQSMGRECGDTDSNSDGFPNHPDDPKVGTADCSGMSSTADSSPDIFWFANGATGTVANLGVSAADARTTAKLNLPTTTPGVETIDVRYARLFWASIVPQASPDAGLAVNLTAPGDTAARALVADTSFPTTVNSGFFYQSSVDVTALVSEKRSGQYTVGNFKMQDILNVDDDQIFFGWYMVVIYESSEQSVAQRHIAVFNGFDFISSSDTLVSKCDARAPTGPSGLDAEQHGVCFDVSGFLVPSAVPGVVDSRIGVVTFEGDKSLHGDSLQFRVNREAQGPSGNTGPTGYSYIYNANNPPTNFFNGSNTYFGDPVSLVPCTSGTCNSTNIEACYCNDGHLPQNTGRPFSGGGMDVDVFTLGPSGVTGRPSAEQSLLKPGDTAAKLRATSTQDFYAVSTLVTSFATLAPAFTNSFKKVELLGGRDPREVRPGDRVRYTIKLQNTGSDAAIHAAMTDTIVTSLDLDATTIKADQNALPATAAAFAVNGRTLSVPIGTVGPGGVTGYIANGPASSTGNVWYVSFEATIAAGAPTGNVLNRAFIDSAGFLGAPVVEYGTSGTEDPILPNTDTKFTVAECNKDADCGSTTSGKICTPLPSGPTGDPRVCEPGCYGTGGNGCPAGNVCTTTDHTIGQCVQCTSDAQCSGVTPICNTAAHTCGPCSNETQCASHQGHFCETSGACGVCAPTNTSACAQDICVLPLGLCGCSADSQCPTATPICASQLCSACTSDAQCAARDPSLPACGHDGMCHECTGTNKQACTNIEPVCLLDTQTCGCASTDECSGVTPICVSATCDACASDAQCIAKNPGLPACKTSGACGQCSATNSSACTGDKPVCLLDTGLCGCDSDAQCGDHGLCRNDKCVDISCNSQTECAGSEGGNACLPQGTCGCGSDNDCAASLTSTSSCDLSVQHCVPLASDGTSPALKGGRIEGGGLFKCSQSGTKGLWWMALVVLLQAVRLRRKRSGCFERQG